MMTTRTSWVLLQIAPALLVFFLAQFLGGGRKMEPFFTYLYFFSWAPFLWVIDRVLLFRSGRSYFSKGIEKAKLKELIWLFCASTSFWLIFEVINFRIKNWIYIGLPRELFIRWPGYVLSYATVLPGILFLSELIETYFPKKDLALELLYTEVIGRKWSLYVGVGMFILPLFWPRFFFPLVWGSLFFILEPSVQFLGGHSLLQDWRSKRWAKTASLLLGGLICGLFWEGCNYGAGAKWEYTVPFVGFLKIFEMPPLGFLGFPAFALELFVMYQFTLKVWERINSNLKWAAAAGIFVFWLLAFAGIDHFTVFLWRG